MSDGLGTIESIVMSSGPQSVLVKADNGPEGDRGSYFFVGTGSPEDYDFTSVYSDTYPIVELRGNRVYDKEPQLLDWYVNLLPGDETYLSIYQYTDEIPGQPWQLIFKLIPNVISKTFDGDGAIDFGEPLSPTAGIAEISFTASKLELPLPQKFLGESGIPEDAISVDSQSEMLAVDFSFTPNQSNPGYVYRTDLSAFYKTESDVYDTPDAWQKHISISLDLDIENFYPIAKSFVINMPTYDGTNYGFSISVTAANLDPTVPGWVPLTGTKKTHLTLSVI